MLNAVARGPIGAALKPCATALARTRVNPDVLTVIGTTGTVAGSLLLIAHGQRFVGVLVVTAFVLMDMLDGALARERGRTSQWGAFLDSTMDRIGDAAIFGALLWWLGGEGGQRVLAGVALYCLAAGAVVPYIKARAEGLGLTCNVGFAERAERLIIVLVGTGLDGLGIPFVLAAALWFLAVASTITVGQRLATVHRQTRGT